MAFTKMLWLDSTPILGNSWDYWTTVAGTDLFDFLGTKIYKTNGKIAYYAAIHGLNSSYQRFFCPLIMSTDPDAVTYNWGSNPITYQGTITDINNITWYYNGMQYEWGNPSDANLILNDEEYRVYSSESERQRAAQALLDKIYAADYTEDYQRSYEYDLNLNSDYRKIMRKIIGIYLFRNKNESTTAFDTFSNQIDTIMSTLLSNVSGDNKLVRLSCVINSDNEVVFNFYVATSNPLPNKFRPTSKYTSFGYKYWQAQTLQSPSGIMTVSYDVYQAYIDRYGQITYGTMSDSANTVYVGIYAPNSLGTDRKKIYGSNIGIML